MITAWRAKAQGLDSETVAAGAPVPGDALWLDLVEPSDVERSAVADALNMSIPTRTDMLEIELSSRLYQEADALFMTVSLVTGGETDRPSLEPVTFILAGASLVTVRHHDFKAFGTFIAHVRRDAASSDTARGVLFGLLDAIVDRLADVLERVQNDADDISHNVYRSDRSRSGRELEHLLRRIGLAHNLTTRVRESLLTIGRALTFIGRPDEVEGDKASLRLLTSLAHDIAALSDHATYLGSNINFLLDSSLGMINIAQNAIIKIVSVAALVFLPPTLIASVYGMNFQFMPELGWPIGYPLALAAMALSAVVPYAYFKYRGWL